MQNFFIWLKVISRSSKHWWLWKEPVVGWHWWLWKEPVVMCGNWNIRSQQVFKVTTFCTDTCLQSFSPLVNCIVHHAVLKFSPCRNKTLLQLVHIADWYLIHMLLQHGLDAVVYRVEVRTVGWPHVRTDELGCLAVQKLDCVTVPEMTYNVFSGTLNPTHSLTSRMCWRCAGTLSCWKTNTPPAMLQIAGSSFCISNTSQ